MKRWSISNKFVEACCVWTMHWISSLMTGQGLLKCCVIRLAPLQILPSPHIWANVSFFALFPIFRQHAASIYGFVCQFCFVCQKKNLCVRSFGYLVGALPLCKYVCPFVGLHCGCVPPPVKIRDLQHITRHITQHIIQHIIWHITWHIIQNITQHVIQHII